VQGHIRELISRSVRRLVDAGRLPALGDIGIQVERTRQKEHGDFATNISLILAKSARCKPRDLAQQIYDQLPYSSQIDKVEIAGPGFINFFLSRKAWFGVISTIKREGARYGQIDIGGGKRVLVEFVSANPTGPLHVGHGRGAAYGDTLARVLRANGYDVASEYYLNDAGRQMDVLTASVWLRYVELCGDRVDFPKNAYQGAYISDIAAALRDTAADALKRDPKQIIHDLSDDAEAAMDELISRLKNSLGPERYQDVYRLAVGTLTDNIRDDLAEFGIHYDCWFSEKGLVERGAVERAIERLKERGHLYTRDGAWWFRSTRFGDEKDRVMIRSNGEYTYFAGDTAYHLNKIERGFEQLINIWGADHHGHVKRMKAAFEAFGEEPDHLQILLVQFVSLYRGGNKVSMSTRGGEFVTLRELRQEVGNDAARFFYVLRKAEQQMDFDLDLAKSQSNDNPVYYIQYAHARICSVFSQIEQRNLGIDITQEADFDALGEDVEIQLLNILSRFPEVVASAAADCEPHQIAYYLRDLATQFHTYYNAHPFLSAEPEVRDARLGLIDAVRQVLSNGLTLLGVSAPESM